MDRAPHADDIRGLPEWDATPPSAWDADTRLATIEVEQGRLLVHRKSSPRPALRANSFTPA